MPSARRSTSGVPSRAPASIAARADQNRKMHGRGGGRVAPRSFREPARGAGRPPGPADARLRRARRRRSQPRVSQPFPTRAHWSPSWAPSSTLRARGWRSTRSPCATTFRRGCPRRPPSSSSEPSSAGVRDPDRAGDQAINHSIRLYGEPPRLVPSLTSRLRRLRCAPLFRDSSVGRAIGC